MKQTFKNFILNVATRCGYTLIPNWRMTTYPQAVYLRRLFDHCNIDTVIDVGANEGQYRDFIRSEVGFTGDIISVEPIPELITKLHARASADQRWRIEACALAATNGTAALNVMNRNQFSSLLSPDHGETSHFRDMNSIHHTVAVKTKTLDAIVESLSDGQTRRVYLKLDTQGFDLEVLKGGTNSLPRIFALQTEASFKRLYAGAPPYEAVVAYLSEHGFDLSAAHPNNEGHFPLLIEMDFHFINRTSIPPTLR